MAKRRYSFDEAKNARYMKEGRGKGHGRGYKPWLTIQDVPSLGRVSRVHGFTSGRLHHFLSDLETSLFYLLEWCESVTDIREQFPLDREVTRMLAHDMGVIHPRDTHTQTDVVMTTDFVVDVIIDGCSTTVARAVKPSKELGKKRTLEKLEIERRYWDREGVSWALVTERELPRRRVTNIRWLLEMKTLDHMDEPYPGYWADRCNQFLGRLRRIRQGTIQSFTKLLEEECGFAVGEPLTVLRHLAANRSIQIDLDQEFSVLASIRSLKIATDRSARQRRSA